MNIDHIEEPRLVFGSDALHVCPRRGIAVYGVYDKDASTRAEEIRVGAVGTSVGLQRLDAWLVRCRSSIDAPADTRQPNLFPSFPGFKEDAGFYSRITFGATLCRTLRNSDIEAVRNMPVRYERVNEAVELYYEEIQFLAQNRPVDVVVCVIPEALYKSLTVHEAPEIDETLEPDDAREEHNFRRALKARAMKVRRPLQLVREVTLKAGTAGQQDEATKAWNFCTALYYKFAPTVPWKLVTNAATVSTCAVGIAFYKSRDRRSLGTSLAQVFDELGNGLIVRGTPVALSKEDRRPHLSADQTYSLLRAAMREYRRALKAFPARVVVHKSSEFSDEELDGCREAVTECRIHTVDFVTVMDSRLQLFREGRYPPFRGTLWHVDDTRQVLYTRGSVWYYKTYPGMYVPRPLELRVVRSELAPTALAHEVLRLTKLNWNNTRLDGKYPVTVGCARKVGEIMKYIEDTEEPEIRYAYYM